MTFFVELDRHTFEDIATDEMRRSVAFLKDCLMWRIIARAEAVRDGTTPEIFDPEPGDFCRILLVMQQLVGDYLRGGDFRVTCKAFDQFANGDLRVRLDDGSHAIQPSSASFFLFAELALSVVERFRNSALWLNVARSTVAAQRVFLRAYPRTAAGPGFGAYSACSYLPQSRRTERDLSDQRSAYADRDYDHLLADHALCAFEARLLSP